MSQTDREWAEKIVAATKTLFAKHGGIMHGPSFRELLAAELAEFRKAVLTDIIIGIGEKFQGPIRKTDLMNHLDNLLK